MYLDSAIVLAEVAAPLALAVAVAVPPDRRRQVVAIVAGVWLVASVVLAALYPSPLVRGESLQRIYLAADLICLFISIVALFAWGRASIKQQRRPSSSGMVGVALVALDLGILLVPHSPWRDGTWIYPYGHFDIIQIGIVVFFAIIAIAQGIAWNFSPR